MGTRNTEGGHRLFIVEVKAVLSFQEYFRPRAKDVQQVQAYMHFLATIPRSLLIYKSRSSGEIRVFPVSYDPEIGRGLEEKAVGVLKAVDHDEVPACECGRCRR